MFMGSGGQEGVPPWIFIHGTDIVERGLIVLFLGIFFRCLPRPWKFFCRRLCLCYEIYYYLYVPIITFR